MHIAISWFTRNPVAANLLMTVLVVGGVMGMLSVHQQEFPSIDVQMIAVTVPYLGAAPEESEQAVCVRIEEAIEGVEGIDTIRATASEGACTVMAELDMEADDAELLNEIKSRVDGVNTFPAETEKPIVSKGVIMQGVVQVAVSGNADERTLKEVGQAVRDDIAAIEGISQVSLTYVRPYEISIEVSEFMLRRYGLTLDQVALAVRHASLDMPGGTIRTEGGEILIRTKGQVYWGQEFEDIVVLTRPDGTKVTLREVATIRDGFEEGDLLARFNGEPAVVVKVFQVGKEDSIQMARDVKAYLEKQQPLLPPGIKLTVWTDSAAGLTERLNTLTNTALTGLLLVVIILALFLRFRLAMWVAAGIPIALFGTIAVFPYADISISTMTVMAFILVLGILVDDAIVVGERVYAHEQMGKDPVSAAIDGTREVSTPVIFGVLTTMAAFLPLLIVPGRMASFFGVIGMVVIIALAFSIIESQLILPAHLAHRNHQEPDHGLAKRWNVLQGRLSGWLENVASQRYQPLLRLAVEWRYATAAVGVGILILTLGLVVSGRVVFGFFPSVEGDRVYAQLEMPEGISVDVTARAAERLEASALVLQQELDQHRTPEQGSVINNVLSSIGAMVERNGPVRPRAGSSNFAEVVIELVPLKQRNDLSAKVVAARWRELAGNIPDAVKLTFNADDFSSGDPINYEISGKDVDSMREAAAELRAELGRYEGVFDIADSFRAGKQEIKLTLLPEGRTLGVTLNDLARQVRNAFYGAEAQRIQRGQDEVRVLVRFPEQERTSIGNLEDMYIRTPDGSEVPFYSVAQFELGRGYSSINRVDGRRVVNVIADVDRSKVSPEEVNASIQQNILPGLIAKYRNISIGMSGEQEERAKSMMGLASAFLIALVIIYALLAIPLRSYVQPLVIMSVIPFGAVGALIGHWLMGITLVFFSALGIVALSGVVVNSSLVLVDNVNRQRRNGVTLQDAILNAGVVRFRPILLTSVTTFMGLVPLMLTTTPATFFIIPMAVSLAYGVLFATFITLFMVPALYTIAEDVFGWDPVSQGMEQPNSTAQPH